MKKKIVNGLNNKIVNVILVMLCVMFFIFLGIVISREIMIYKNSSILNGNKNYEYYFDNFLFHIVYENDEVIYDYLIDENYNISEAIKKKEYKNEFVSILENKHNKIEFLDDTQKEWLINYLNNLNYTNNSFDIKKRKYYYYKVVNCKNDNSVVFNDVDNKLLYVIVNSLINKDKSIYDYLLKNNYVTNFIRDLNYIPLDTNDEKVIDLFSKAVPSYYSDVKINGSFIESYKNGLLTNDSIIIVTYDNMTNIDNGNNCIYNSEEVYNKTCYINKSDFDKTLKRIFGNIDYDISIFQKFENQNGDVIEYDAEKNQLKVNIKEGATPTSFFYSDIAYAYNIDNKIVIIEKNLYYSMDENVSEGLYESVDKNVLLLDGYIASLDKPESYLNELEPFLTYYAHTFTLNKSGNYYYTNIERLN